MSVCSRAADAASAEPANVYAHEGVSVAFAVVPTLLHSASPRAGEPARVRFTITDTTTGKPLSGLHPAAWLSRKIKNGSALRPQTAAEKVREFLGGSIFSRAELDLNEYVVLVMNDDASIAAINPEFGFGSPQVLSLIRLPGVGEDWALLPDGTRLFVSIPSTNKIAVINTANWSVASLVETPGHAHQVRVQPDAHYAWAACDSGSVMVMSANDAALTARIETGRGPHEILFSADSRWAFVVNAGEHTISIIDVRTLRKTKEMDIGSAPDSAAYSALAETVLLTDGIAGKIIVFDALKHEVITRISTPTGIGQIRFTPEGRFAVVAVPERNQVLVIDAANNRIVQQCDIDEQPDRFAFSTDMCFVVSRHNSYIAMLPLGELGHDGQPVAVADFPAGDHVFGRATSLGDCLTATPGEPAVVVANPDDKSVYYYMEGMAAPQGNFSNGSRIPRAVLTLDRSLRERAPGVYETIATLPASGAYDVVFFLDSPEFAHCFDAMISPGAATTPSLAGYAQRRDSASAVP